MAELVCQRCGVTVEAYRTGRNRYQTRFGEEMAYCEEMRERLAEGEESVAMECSEIDKALKRAIAAGET